MNNKDKRNEIITARCTEEEKAMISKKAQARDKSISDYILGCSIAGLERRRDKDRRRMVLIIENQEILKELKECLEKKDAKLDVAKAQSLVEKLKRGEQLLWDF